MPSQKQYEPCRKKIQDHLTIYLSFAIILIDYSEGESFVGNDELDKVTG